MTHSTPTSPEDALPTTIEETLPASSTSVTAAQALWSLFADVGQSLQVSAASIKAATSSLLDRSIFWDPSAQNEFTESIDKTVDQISAISVAMTLALKATNGQLTYIYEPNSILEILSRVADALGQEMPGLTIRREFPAGGRMVNVDYDYMRLGLRFLLEALMSANPAPLEELSIRAAEEQGWVITISADFTDAGSALINWLTFVPTPSASVQGVQAEAMLKALTARQLFTQQGILLENANNATDPVSITLSIPFAEE